jgi:DNA-binding transcriptional ArsR family regulator|tara:strand:+ start:20984 stop:21439 length:456 start_codon:yes stop_codon:yes gene_type:complete
VIKKFILTVEVCCFNICTNVQVFKEPAMNLSRIRLIEEDGCEIRMIHFDRVEQARREVIADHELDRLSLTYKVLGDPNRLKIVMALKNVEMCVCDLAAFTGLTDSAISHQLRRLKDLALVKSRRDGRIIYYSLDDEHVKRLLTIGLEHARE